MFMFLVMIFTVYETFVIKYHSREKIRELQKLDKMIAIEKEKIALLNIDLEHLSRPNAIRTMLYLVPELQPITPQQIIIITK